jgi:hypothetical protein
MFRAGRKPGDYHHDMKCDKNDSGKNKVTSKPSAKFEISTGHEVWCSSRWACLISPLHFSLCKRHAYTLPPVTSNEHWNSAPRRSLLSLRYVTKGPHQCTFSESQYSARKQYGILGQSSIRCWRGRRKSINQVGRNASQDWTCRTPLFRTGESITKDVLLYKQITRPMTDSACRIWCSLLAAVPGSVKCCTPKCLRIATNESW